MLLTLGSSIVSDHTNIWKDGDHGVNERTVSEFVKTEREENSDKHAMLAGNQIFGHGLDVYHYISLPGTSWSTEGTKSTDLCVCASIGQFYYKQNPT
jgi:hypothetical protein